MGTYHVACVTNYKLTLTKDKGAGYTAPNVLAEETNLKQRQRNSKSQRKPMRRRIWLFVRKSRTFWNSDTNYSDGSLECDSPIFLYPWVIYLAQIRTQFLHPVKPCGIFMRKHIGVDPKGRRWRCGKSDCGPEGECVQYLEYFGNSI